MLRHKSGVGTQAVEREIGFVGKRGAAVAALVKGDGAAVDTRANLAGKGGPRLCRVTAAVEEKQEGGTGALLGRGDSS